MVEKYYGRKTSWLESNMVGNTRYSSMVAGKLKFMLCSICLIILQRAILTTFQVYFETLHEGLIVDMDGTLDPGAATPQQYLPKMPNLPST